MNTFYIVLTTLIIYSLVGTVLFIITKENEDVAIYFGLGIVGLTLCGILMVIRKVRDKFKYHIGKRSIFEEISTGKKYKCKVKDAEDIHCWVQGYKMLKLYATKSEWIDIPDFNEEFIFNSKKNCNNCKYYEECMRDSPRFTVKCKHDSCGTVLEFDKFESK